MSNDQFEELYGLMLSKFTAVHSDVLDLKNTLETLQKSLDHYALQLTYVLKNGSL